MAKRLWSRLQHIVVRPKARTLLGRPRVSDLKCLYDVLFILKTGIAWEDLPSKAFGCTGMTCWRRFNEWTKIWRRGEPVVHSGAFFAAYPANKLTYSCGHAVTSAQKEGTSASLPDYSRALRAAAVASGMADLPAARVPRPQRRRRSARPPARQDSLPLVASRARV